MRIIAGELRGRRLKVPRQGVRPTTDRLRESLFNYLGPSVAGSTWLDAFAGCGAVGIEALSRGATQVVFNDSDWRVAEIVRKNLELCGVEDRASVLELDVFKMLKQLEHQIFDFVFLDPPYQFRQLERLLRRVSETVISSESVVLLEAFKKTVLPAQDWHVDRVLKAGDSHLHVLRLRSGEPAS